MAALVFAHALLFLLFWVTNLVFRQAVNDFLGDAIGLQADYLLWFMLFTALVGGWSAALLSRRRKMPGLPAAFKGVGTFYLLFFYGSFIVLFVKNPVQLPRLGQFLQYFRFFVDTALLLLAARGLRRLLTGTGARWKKLAALGAFLALWLVPVFWTPGLVYRGALPPKPRPMAHRGASTLAPENTLAAMQAAADLGVYGLESDVVVSTDGVLFLMHDSTLARTTNVAQVFPQRQNDPSYGFTWAELSQLDAGAWFEAQFAGEPIPTLTGLLDFARENDLSLIFDLRLPPADHPYAASAFDQMLAEVGAADMSARTWLLVSPEEVAPTLAVLPEAVLAAGVNYRHPPAPDELVSAGYRVVNSEFGLSNRMIRTYKDAGLWVNLYTVDEPWQYSRLWLAGADSVTSNTIQEFIALSRPVMAMPYSIYLIVWGLIGIGAAGSYAWRPQKAR